MARGVYKQLRAHDKALDKHLQKARERGQAAADAAAATQVGRTPASGTRAAQLAAAADPRVHP